MIVRSKHRRQDILDAAIRVFAEKGYYTANVSDVARAAGVAQGTIYLYFESKEDLLLAIFQEKMGELIDYLEEQLQQVQGAEARLERLIHIQLEQIETYPELTELILVELRQSRKFLRAESIEPIERYLHLVEDILRAGIQEGVFSASIDVSVTATMVYAALEGLATRWILEGRSQSLDTVAETVKRVFLEGIRREGP